MNQLPLVTVWCITYNQKNYIEDALNGFLNQRTDFEYEILIHDDASTDGTTEILQEYEKRYPERIRVLYEEENLYQQGKLSEYIHHECWRQMQGKYLALCEGDDYWIDPNKLQIQVDYLEAHPECYMTGHNGLQFDERSGKQLSIDGFPSEQDVTMKDILLHRKLCFPTASFVIKREVFNLPIPYIDCKIGDWMLQLYACTLGAVHYFDRIMCVYRFYSSGSWTQQTYHGYAPYLTHMIDMAHFFERFDTLTKEQYHDTIAVMVEGFLEAGADRLRENDARENSELFQKLSRNLSFDISPYWNRLCEARERIGTIKAGILDFAKKYVRLYVMGTGDAADIVSVFLDNSDVRYEGYVISDDQMSKGMFRGKSVWHLSEIAKIPDEYGVIVAIQKKLREEIEKALDTIGISNYRWAWM